MTQGSVKQRSTYASRLLWIAGLSMQLMAVPPAVPWLAAIAFAQAERERLAQAPTVPLATRTQDTSTPPVDAAQGQSYLLMIVPFDEGELEAQAMENWFQSCATDEPFALELVGTRREQGFLLRTNSRKQRDLLRKQFEAQHPQAEIIIDPPDPLVMHPSHVIVVGEFALAQDAWLPIKTFSGEALAAPGGDPLAHILASMEAVCDSHAGTGQCITAQLVLQRAPDTWIAPDIRKAVEHPLQEERDEQSAALKGVKGGGTATNTTEGLKTFLLLAVGLLAYLGYRFYQERNYLPLWVFGFVTLAGMIGLLWWRIRTRQRPIYDMRLVSEKLVRQAFYCQLRVIVKGSPPPLSAVERDRRAALSPEEVERLIHSDRREVQEQLSSHLDQVAVAYRQFSLASANSLFLKRTRVLQGSDDRALSLGILTRAFPYQHPFLRFLHGGPTTCVLNSLELSGLFHLPQALTDLPLVRRTSVKHLLFSPALASKICEQQGPLPPVPIGTSRHRGHSVRVALPFSVQSGNKFVVGRSRSGKTVLVQHLSRGMLQPVQKGTPQPGLFVIDPHRDLVEDLLRLIPLARWRDVMLFDFTNTQYPVALNPLDASMGLSRDQAVSSLTSAVERIYHETWGPRMSYFLIAVFLTLYTLNEQLVDQKRADEQYTLLDINPLLQYQDYATRVLSELNPKDPWHQELLAWWAETYYALGTKSQFRNEIIMPILSKFGVFNNNATLRRIVGQPVTKMPVHLAVTEGKIVLCSLSSRDMDDMAVNVLGSTVCNLLHASFRMQQDVPLLRRRKVFVAVDEFQNFSGTNYDKLLSEDAKFGCAMLLSTQNLSRLSQPKQGLGLLEVALSNCQHLFAFNMSAADAEFLEKEYQKKVLLKDFISQPPLHCYMRLAFPDEPIQIASLFLDRLPNWDATPFEKQEQERLVAAIRWNNQQGMHDAAAVDDHHQKHLQRFLNVAPFAGWITRSVMDLEREQRYRDANQQAQETQDSGESTPEPSDVVVNQTTVEAGEHTPPSDKGTRQEQEGQQNGHRESGHEQKQSHGGKASQGSSAQENGKDHTAHSSRRLARLRKNQAGTPPPDLPPDGGQSQWPSSDDGRRSAVPSGMNYGWKGREGREGRERGDRV